MKEKHDEVIIPEGSVFLDKYGLWVSRDGRIFRQAAHTKSSHKADSIYEMKQNPSAHGYLAVHWHGHSKSVHRLIAEAFIPNPDNHRTVDHINRNILDNRIENLRWCSWSDQESNRSVCDKENLKYGVRHSTDPKQWYINKRKVGRLVSFNDGHKRFLPHNIADELLKIPKQLRFPPDTESPASARPTGLSI